MENRFNIPKSPEPNSTIPIRALVVEDEEGIAELVELMLGINPNVSADKCVTGEEALDRLREAKAKGNAYDLVISDLGLPGISGNEIARIVKEEFLADRFTLFTGDPDKARAGRNTQQLKVAGVDNIISKPALVQLFRAEVNNARIAKQLRSTNPQK